VTDAKVLSEAAFRGDLPTTLGRVSLEEIADAWWRYTLRSQERDRQGHSSPDEHDPDWWAVELWIASRQEHKTHEETVRQLTHLLAERAPAEGDLGFLGAGPVEDFIDADEDRLQWIEQEAERSENFRRALANAWIDDLGPTVFLRVQRAAGTELVWPLRGSGPRPMPDGSFADPSLHRSTT